ncbi:MAG: hypothetical protein KBT46_00390 [Ruminococcus sp.]|nr:hypothetical protein [Candidatus Copronaster equi]
MNKRPSKAELKEILIKKLNEWMGNGDTPEQAVEKLTIKQYDFLIDQGVDFDNLLLTPEQRANAKTLKRSARSCSPNGYNKKYPQSKQDLYNNILCYIKEQGATIIEPKKVNYRDLDFVLNNVTYKIVLSNPRT